MSPRSALAVTTLLLLCGSTVAALLPSADPAQPATPSAPPVLEAAWAATGPAPARAPEPTLPAPARPADDWESWCEPADPPACRQDADCAGVRHPSGKATKCVKPWWARSDDLRVCAAPWPTRRAQRLEARKLRLVVRYAYFDEAKHCKLDGRPVHREHWRCQEQAVLAGRLHRFLIAQALGETALRPWKRHRLNPDLKANRRSWLRSAHGYGHRRIQTPGGTRVEFLDGGNPHYREARRWEHGLGLYGQNAALWTAAVDPLAPPEILCRPVEATEGFLRGARSAWRKIQSGDIDCDEDGKGEARVPTWADIYHAVASGKFCPSSRSRAIFGKRLAAAAWLAPTALDPDAPVESADLGKPIPRSKTRELADEIRAKVEAEITTPH